MVCLHLLSNLTPTACPTDSMLRLVNLLPTQSSCQFGHPSACSGSNCCTNFCFSNFCDRPSACSESGIGTNFCYSNLCPNFHDIPSSRSEPNFQFCDHSSSRSEPTSVLDWTVLEPAASLATVLPLAPMEDQSTNLCSSHSTTSPASVQLSACILDWFVFLVCLRASP